MKSHVEFEAKNIEQAIEKACVNFRVSKEELEYDVLSYGSSGIFGIVGAKNAKIRVKEKVKEKTTYSNSIVDEIFSDKKNRTNLQSDKKENNEVPEAAASDSPEPEVDYDMLLEIGTETLEKIVGSISLDVVITSSLKNDGVFFDINCADPSALIGRKGRTLDAIHYILEKILNKKQKSRIHSQIDIEGYLEKRQAKLVASALQLSEKVKRLKKPISMGEISFNDRRTVHLLLKKDNDIKTRSIGNGPYKKLIIFPRNDGYEKRDAGEN